MEFINLILVKDGIVDSMETYAKTDDQDETAVKESEDMFRELAEQEGFDEEDIETGLENGYIADGEISINLVWSRVEGL